jgi:DtxR family manganese transport transcriptional regulator
MTGTSSRTTPEPLQDAEEQASTFDHTRRARQAEVAEDYVELIGDLIDATGEARSVDLAKRLGVTHATVAKTLAKLRREGLVRYQPYRSIFLTDDGRALADASRERHRIVLEFLRALGVCEATAQLDSEGIEHHVSAETLAALARFVERQKS